MSPFDFKMVISCVAFGCRNRQHVRNKCVEVCENLASEEENDILVETDYEARQCNGAHRPRPISFHRLVAFAFVLFYMQNSRRNVPLEQTPDFAKIVDNCSLPIKAGIAMSDYC